jgi:hypothetical protein
MGKIFIGCLALNHTGGLTLAHQLCFELRRIGYDAYMYYYFSLRQKRQYPVNEHYEKYHLPYVEKLEDESGNVIVAPETNVELLRHVKHATKVIWWMSVDNYHLTQHTLKGRIINVFGLRRFKIEQPDIYHLAQSYYAIDFLRHKVDESHIMYLSDYLDDEFIESVQSHATNQRKDMILYNPSKGFEFTQKIMHAASDLQWYPLQGLTPLQMREVMGGAKVYIDFGHHPGKDRIPRETAISGCCVLTGMQGAARFQQDVPIPQKYKFEDSENSISAIISMIRSCLTDYEGHIKDFEEYREMIRQEHDRFSKDVREIFKKLTT